MKTKIFGLLALSALLPLASVQAEDKADDKMYVTGRTVSVLKKKIVVFTDEGMFKTDALFSDDNGLYVKKSELQQVQMEQGKQDRLQKFKKFTNKKFRNFKKFKNHKRGCQKAQPAEKAAE